MMLLLVLHRCCLMDTQVRTLEKRKQSKIYSATADNQIFPNCVPSLPIPLSVITKKEEGMNNPFARFCRQE
jgi:hypothetical protein